MNRQFLIVTTTAILLSIELCAQVIVPNGGFEQPDLASKTKAAYWKAESDNFICIADNHEPYVGTYSLKVSSTSKGNHFFNEEFPFTTEGLKKYKIKCAIKTKNLNGTIQLGARVYDANGSTVTKTTFMLTENSNQPWTMAEGVFVSDLTASKLRVFGNITGTGDAWFDEIAITEIPAPVNGPSSEVALYIHEYFDIIYEHSIVTDRNYIVNLKARSMYLCSDGVDVSACRDILKHYTTPMLQDGHSFFVTKEEWKEMTQSGRHPATGEVHHNMPEGRMLKDKIAVITIPTFISSDPELMQQYGDSLQNIIAGFDRQNVNGYLVDLSNNGGGNSLPMIAGIGPLIGNGICGYSFSGNGSMKTRVYSNGCIGWDSIFTFCKHNAYVLKYPRKPIAVIYGNQTGSSGEVTAIAFIGLSNSRSFGQPTAGASTRVDNFEMSDGSYLNLASGVDADRNQNRFGGKIEPDVKTPDNESAILSAAKWILDTSK